MKKLTLFLLTFILLIIPAYPQEKSAENIENSKIKKEIQKAIVEIYGEADSDIIFDNVIKLSQKDQKIL